FRDRHVDISHINVGGGLGVDYETPDDCLPDMRDFFSIFHRFLKLLPGQTLHFEPGRILVASCGDLITRVLFVKKGMTELIRPALYQAYHKIENLSRADAGPNGFYDVVGPICESSDCFGKALPLPHTQRGDLLAIRTAGAYGEVMASNYNLRPHARVVYSDELCVR
ncbi:MAG: diaminopimelate decarboxylase, partial [Flavobacteriales bacterium]